MNLNTLEIIPVEKLNRDIKKAGQDLSPEEARYLVDMYYTIQENRKATGNQVFSLGRDEPGEVLRWFYKQHYELENNIKKVLDSYTSGHEVGKWLKSITGIGPVIAAGLLAHIDITKAPTVGHIWSYAGLNPNQVWEKGQKRPWNARLKVLCWKIGESFVKVHNNPKGYYGHIYAERKELEIERNEAGQFADQAAAILQAKKIGKTTEAYKWYSEGKLPPAHIHARAKRYAVKLFLSHLHEFWYEQHYGEKPPLPYPIAILGHAHKIDRPD
jgi:hypothetical protein